MTSYPGMQVRKQDMASLLCLMGSYIPCTIFKVFHLLVIDWFLHVVGQ